MRRQEPFYVFLKCREWFLSVVDESFPVLDESFPVSNESFPIFNDSFLILELLRCQNEFLDFMKRQELFLGS